MTEMVFEEGSAEGFDGAAAAKVFDFDAWEWGDLDQHSQKIAKIGAAVGVSQAVQSVFASPQPDGVHLYFSDSGSGVTIVSKWDDLFAQLHDRSDEDRREVVSAIRAALDNVSD
jgi:hypothetical protein